MPHPSCHVRSLYLDIAASFPDVEAAILNDPQGWVPGLLRAADDRGQILLAEVGFAVDTRRIDKRVEIELGAPIRTPAKAVLPITWRATRPEGLFPQLDADIEVASLGADRTQLSISARYRAPMGAVGRMLDRAMLHRVAEATVKDFLDRVGDQLRTGELAKFEP